MYLRYTVARKSAIRCSTFLNSSSWPPNLTFQCQLTKINNNIAPTCTRHLCKDEKHSELTESGLKIQDNQGIKRPAGDRQKLDTQNVPDFESPGEDDKQNFKNTYSGSKIQNEQKSLCPTEQSQILDTADYNETRQNASEMKNPEDSTKNLDRTDSSSKILSMEELERPEDTCCMTGCANCVWLDYAEKLTEYYRDGGDKALREIEEKIKDPSLKAFLLHEIKMRQS